MFKKIFSLSNSAKQSFANSGDNFKMVATAAKDFVSHSSAAVNVVPELGQQIGSSVLGGGVAVIAGLGLCVASALFFPAFIAPVTSAVGWGVFSHPFSVIGIATVSSFFHNSANLETFSANSLGAIKDAVSIPYHAAKGLGEAVIGSGKVAYNVANETLIAVRSPDQQATDNKDGQHIQNIGDSWFKSTPERNLAEEDFTNIENDLEEDFVELTNANKQELLPEKAVEITTKDLASYFADAVKYQELFENDQVNVTGDALEIAVAGAAAA